MKKPPTTEQINRLKTIYKNYIEGRPNEAYGLTLDLWRKPPSTIPTSIEELPFYNKKYDINTPWKTIERDIRQFYETGKGPSITQQFHR